MAARLASGRALVPRLIKTINGVETEITGGESLGINENYLRMVRGGMNAVSNSARGTAYRSRIIEDGYQLAGKTGTSQVRSITKAERAKGVIKNKDLPWERRDHALFVAFAPVENPRFAVSVVVEHGGGGSTAAAPIARDILLQAEFGGLPPLSAYPSNQRKGIAKMREGLTLRDPAATAPRRIKT